MRILIANDDGIASEGLRALAGRSRARALVLAAGACVPSGSAGPFDAGGGTSTTPTAPTSPVRPA